MVIPVSGPVIVLFDIVTSTLVDVRAIERFFIAIDIAAIASIFNDTVFGITKFTDSFSLLFSIITPSFCKIN